MAQVHLRVVVRKRWFFGPAFFIVAMLHHLGIIRNLYRPAAWLIAHGMVWTANGERV